MGTETEAAPGAEFKNAVELGPKQTPHPVRRRILWLGVLGWTALVGLALWWLVKGNGGPSVWVFQERDLHQPGFSEKVQAIFRGELGLQRTYPWILFGPFLALMAWFFPLERERLRRNLPLNVAACLTFAWACQALDLSTSVTRANVVVVSSEQAPGGGIVPFRTARLVPPGRTSTAVGSSGHDELLQPKPLPVDFRPAFPPPRSSKVSLRSAILDLLAYGAISGLVHSVNFYGRLRERERRALVLESNLAKARLNMLKAQLQPHFLFNSLNAIATLLRRDPRLAETTLVALSELLRLALSQSGKQEGSLREELEFVRRYLEIQQTRFGDKLRVEQDIDPLALECTVPTLVLQPLVENAIRHGIEPGEKPGVVRVSAARQKGKLVLTVEDDGVGLAGGCSESGGVENPAGSQPGLPAPARSSTISAGTGIGLANLRDRLQALYGDGQKLELTPRATGGVAVHVEIPWKSRASSETTNSFDA
jgi:hypothetical protein